MADILPPGAEAQDFTLSVTPISLLVLAYRLRPHRDDGRRFGGAALHGV